MRLWTSYRGACFSFRQWNAANPRQFREGFNNGDRLHPNDAGYKAMAEAVDLTLFTKLK